MLENRWESKAGGRLHSGADYSQRACERTGEARFRSHFPSDAQESSAGRREKREEGTGEQCQTPVKDRNQADAEIQEER